MLRCEIPDTRFVDDVGQMDGMARRKTVVASGLEMQEFVQGIAVGRPRRAFLIGSEEIAVAIPLERHHIAKAARELFHFAVRGDAQKAATAFVSRVVVRARFLVGPVGVGGGGAAHREVERTVRAEGNGHGVVDAALQEVAGLGKVGVVETGGEHLARLGHPVAIAVAEPDDFAREDEIRLAVFHRNAERIVGIRLFGKRVDLVLKSVAIGVAQHVEAPVVTAGEEPTVGGILDVVQTGELHRQFANGKAGHEHLCSQRTPWRRAGHERGGRLCQAGEGGAKHGDSRGESRLKE